MLQTQYYSNDLSLEQKQHIVKNYQIKYTTIKNEIEGKISYMIQTFLKDISAFIDNIEDIAKEREKLKELERTKKEIKILSDKLTEKNKTEKKLQTEIEFLHQELQYMKKELNSYKDKSNNHSEVIHTEISTTNQRKPLHTPSPSTCNFSKLQYMDSLSSNNVNPNIVFTHCRNLSSLPQNNNHIYKTPKKLEINKKKSFHNLSTSKDRNNCNSSFIHGDSKIQQTFPFQNNSNNNSNNIPIPANVSKKKISNVTKFINSNSQDSNVVKFLNMSNPNKYTRRFVKNSKGRNNIVIKNNLLGQNLTKNDLLMFKTEGNNNILYSSKITQSNNNNRQIEDLFKEYDKMLKCEIDMLDNEAKVIEALMQERTNRSDSNRITNRDNENFDMLSSTI